MIHHHMQPPTPELLQQLVEEQTRYAELVLQKKIQPHDTKQHIENMNRILEPVLKR
jgi:hypothetical protein